MLVVLACVNVSHSATNKIRYNRSMSGDLLQTKLYVPRLRPFLVPRPHLIKRLNDGLHLNRKLTLISASAGFGKTTLLCNWIDELQSKVSGHAKDGSSVAWLSLDESDGNLARFLTYLVAALQTVSENIGAGVVAKLQAAQLPPIDSILTTLLNEIAAIQDDFMLILDDHHLVDAKPVDDALAFLLENLPPQMHLVIATREDPNLPLARLRVRGQLTELRAADLRFTPAEATSFLNELMNLDLSTAAIAALEARTEGWVAGLQMAALAMQERTDVATFVENFTGTHRFVIDYLVEEILQQQSEQVRDFLLQTAVLDRLTGSLCDAVTEQENGKEMLEALERANLFIIPLDDQRQWYRYHHLLADVLQARLLEKQPQHVLSLHQRASVWYEQNGALSAAVRHALAANELERVASLAERSWLAMDNSFRFAAWLDWVKALPNELLQARPVLAVQYARALTDAGEVEASEFWLQTAEECLDRLAGAREPLGSLATEIIVKDEAQFQSLPARMAIIRAINAQIQEAYPRSVQQAELALELTPEEDELLRAHVMVHLGFIYWVNGDLQAAQKAIVDWIDRMQQEGNISFVIASSFALADIFVAQGQLHAAVRTYQQALQQAAASDQQVQHVIAHHHLGLAMLYHEMGEQGAFAEQLQRAEALGQQSVVIDWPYRWHLAQAHLKESNGELDAAHDLLAEAKRLYVRNPMPITQPIEALRTRIYIRQGRLASAQHWAKERHLSIDDELSYLKEFEHMTLARLLIADYRSNQTDHATRDHSMSGAKQLLARLLDAAEAGRRTGSVIEILMLQAIIQQIEGSLVPALERLERALNLAEQAGYFRIFINEGDHLLPLLRETAANGILPAYVGDLLATLETRPETRVNRQPRPSLASSTLIEPLSQRELDVLRLLQTELSGPEIARELSVALSTVRTHTKSIYSKLNANSRRTAVKRAIDLNLL